MELKILEETKNRLVLEIKGESHTLCNALKEELRKDKSVSVVSYYIAHPDIDQPTFTVETKGTEPRKALLQAVLHIKQENEAFQKAFRKEVK